MSDIIGGTSERLLSTDLASKLLVAIVSVRDVWLLHEWIATTPPPFALDGDDAEEPKTTRRHLVRTQTLLGLKLLFDVLDASLGAVVLVVGAVVVEDILCKVRRPLLGISSYVSFRTRGTIGEEDVHNLSFFVHGEDVRERAGGQGRL